MTSFQDQPIARKAFILGFLPTAFALLIASTAFLLSTFVSMRRSAEDDVSMAAAMLADSVNVAVGFHDEATVRELTGALRENPSIARACVFDEAGAFLAGYVTPGEECPLTFDPAVRFGRARLASIQPIVIGTRRIGTVRVVGNLDRLYRTLTAQAIVTGLAFAAALGAAWLLVGRLRRAITGPIAELSSTADRVSSSDDYSLRAKQTTNDEVGGLVRSFNKMLDAIQRSELDRADLLRRERHASQLKDEFLATISHELRTPLNAILGWTQVLTTTKPGEGTVGHGLEVIRRNAAVQARLIEDLLDVSRLETGKLHVAVEPIDLREVVSISLDSFAAAAAARGVSLDLSLPPDPAWVRADRGRLQQVVSNLASNALKFTPSGGQIVVLVQDDTTHVVCRIRDTGIGMAAEFLPHVFERFRQADSSTTREHGGLGLGLAIAREFVNLHGGTITAHSAGPGQGAEFVVRLPRIGGPESASGSNDVARAPH